MTVYTLEQLSVLFGGDGQACGPSMRYDPKAFS
jgi:hypothetical protein